mmetsp:Transcript_62360/g.117308  ORF Transcript_62360/g.117308 Transcript_62360/m.117308 type:complete len:527 (-) Transcript_62360:468-2048(-)
MWTSIELWGSFVVLLLPLFQSSSFTSASLLDVRVGDSILQLEFDETADLRPQASQILALVKDRVGEYPIGIGCIIGDFLCTERAVTVELHRAVGVSQDQRQQTLFKAQFALAWCSGEGDGPMNISDAPEMQDMMGWQVTNEVYDENFRRIDALGSLRIRCQNELLVMLDYWFENPRLPYSTQWIRALDFLSSLGLDHIGNLNDWVDDVLVGEEGGSVLLPLFSPETSILMKMCAGRVCTVPAACFDKTKWVVPGQRDEFDVWAQTLSNLISIEAGDQNVVPARYLKIRPTSDEFYRRLQSSKAKCVPSTLNDQGEFGPAFIGLVQIHIAHTAELIFHAFSEGWKRSQEWEDSEMDARDPRLPFAVLALPGVGGFNCPWCEDVVSALECGNPGVLKVYFESAFRRSDPICFGNATIFFMHMDCSGQTDRGCSWFGDHGAARAFRQSVIRGLDGGHGGGNGVVKSLFCRLWLLSTVSGPVAWSTPRHCATDSPANSKAWLMLHRSHILKILQSKLISNDFFWKNLLSR